MVSPSVAAIALLVAASVISPATFIFLESSQNQMAQLDTKFNTIMNQTTGFLDNAWNVAQQFQNPDYHYNPAELGNYTAPQTPIDGGN
ncbi:MAG: hypothetical protein ACQCN4_08965 [Candidatus Bathyarchaeia archaeon]|jgi:hypothetical protein